MSCVLTIDRPATDIALPLSASGRLVLHLANGNTVVCENSPGVAADAGGQWPIYRGSVLAFTVPFTCAAAATKSSGKSGGASSAGAAEASVSSAGAFVGRLF